MVLGDGEPALALCSGASVDREYREADVVVRARIVSERWVHTDYPTAQDIGRWGSYFPVTLHRLRVSEVFKGAPGPVINLFQEVTSGRFPVDRGEEYLIFLSYLRPYPGRGTAARGAMHVRFACGQSKPWREVRRHDLARLRRISARR